MVRLVETLEDMRTILNWNTISHIGDFDPYPLLIIGICSNCNNSAWRRVFDRIRDQVVEYLFYALGINIEQRRRRRNIPIEHYLSFACLELQASYDLPRQYTKIHLLLFYLKLARVRASY